MTRIDEEMALPECTVEEAAEWVRKARTAASTPAVPSEEEVFYEIGKQDGYSQAVQDIDLRTGGNGEYFASTIPGRGCPDASTMIQNIVDRFAALAAASTPAVEGEDR